MNVLVFILIFGVLSSVCEDGPVSCQVVLRRTSGRGVGLVLEL